MAKKSTESDSESDYEVVAVSQGQKPGGVVSVRLKPDEMELLVALSEVGARTLSETLRLGLRCLGLQPALAAGLRAPAPRLETRVTTVVRGDTAEPHEWSQPNTTPVVLVK